MQEFQIILKKIWCENFKSLKKFEFILNNTNILIGPTGSGKTNIIELFQLMKSILEYSKGRIINPFSIWWGYDNVVWDRDEKLNIKIGLEYAIIHDNNATTTSTYEIVVNGAGGEFKIVDEVFTFDKKIKIENFRSSLDAYLFDDVIDKLTLEKDPSIQIVDGEVKRIAGEEVDLWSIDVYAAIEDDNYIDVVGSSLLNFVSNELRYIKSEDTSEQVDSMMDNLAHEIRRAFQRNILKKIENEDNLVRTSNYSLNIPVNWEHFGSSIVGLYKLLDKMVILKNINIEKQKSPARLEKHDSLSEDGSNFLSLLFATGKGQIPERISNAVKYAFNENAAIHLILTSDGRVLFEFKENDQRVTFSPPSFPLGLYKLITVELCLSLNSPLVLIDEIENSLHARIIAYILDELRGLDSVSIVTTHSPALIDILSPDELVLIDKNEIGETSANKFDNIQEIKNKLDELGITLSEYITASED